MNVRYRRHIARTAVVIKPAAQARPQLRISSGGPDDDSFPALQVLFGTRGRSRLNQQFPGFEVFDAKGDLISVNVQDRNQVSADPQSVAGCEINFLQRHSQPPCPTAPIWRQSVIHGRGLYHARRRLAIGVAKVKHERLKINNREARTAIGGRSLSQPFARRRPIPFP
jgi:hypothetical protein